MGYRPLIAVTTGHTMPNQPELYIQALNNAGAMAEFIHPHIRKRGIADHYDGFLIPGGKDIAAERYGERQIFPIDPEDRKRTDFELLMLREAISKRRPILGICYGMQLINVFFRGALYQDIGSEIDNAFDHKEGRHEISLDDNPLFKAGDHEVNSSHHQAVRKVGKGLIPFAFSPDGVIEGLYHPDPMNIIAVQWHPERMDNEISKAIFIKFVEACHEHK
jgi:putative glutamine amidotransferase